MKPMATEHGFSVQELAGAVLSAVGAGLTVAWGAFRRHARRAEAAKEQLEEERREIINRRLDDHEQQLREIRERMATKEDLKELKHEFFDEFQRRTDAILQAIANAKDG